MKIINLENGMPILVYDGEKQDGISLSISHEKDYTIAISIIN